MCQSSQKCLERKQRQLIEIDEEYQDVFVEDEEYTDVDMDKPDADQLEEMCLEVTEVQSSDSEQEIEDVTSDTIVQKETSEDPDFYETPPNLRCDECKQSFSSANLYKAHNLLMHSNKDDQQHFFKTNLRCEDCKQSFISLNLYKAHKLLLHSSDDATKAQQNSSNIKKRDIYTDANYDALTCAYCFDKFNSSEERKDHEATHLDEHHPYRCHACSQKFAARHTLKSHYTSHMNLPWPCSYGCGKTFKTKQGRWTHEYKHKNESKPCHVCGKLLKTPWAVNEHIKQMHTELMFDHECSQCHKKFKSQKALYNHAIIHDDNKRTHECEVCKKRFFTKNKLARHNDQVHSGKKV